MVQRYDAMKEVQTESVMNEEYEPNPRTNNFFRQKNESRRAIIALSALNDPTFRTYCTCMEYNFIYGHIGSIQYSRRVPLITLAKYLENAPAKRD